MSEVLQDFDMKVISRDQKNRSCGVFSASRLPFTKIISDGSFTETRLIEEKRSHMLGCVLYQTIVHQPTDALQEVQRDDRRLFIPFVITSLGFSLNRFFPTDHCFAFELRRLGKETRD